MATTSGISSSGSATSSLNGSRTTIAENFDTFLSILTTQLKNQNPLDPLDTNQFTQQLVQFTSVEQQLKTNQFLEALMLSNKSNVNTDAVNYIGKSVTASGVRADLEDGKASWTFTSDADAADATITIKNEAGNVVYSDNGSLGKGSGTFVWNGVGSDGKTYSSGTYSISIAAKNLAGKYVAVSTASTGTVSGVDLSGDEPLLTVGSRQVKLSDVVAVSNPK